MFQPVPQYSGTGVPGAGVATSRPDGSGQLTLLGHQALVLSRWVATVAIVIGLLVLAGWALGIGSLKAVVPGLATMKANTAFAFVLCGFALWLASCGLAQAPTTRACAAGVAAIGLLTLCQYAFGWQFGIDQLLFRAGEDGVPHPGRMAPATAVSFTLLGVAFLTVDARTRGGHWPAQWLALAVAFGASLALLGYGYGVESLYRLGAYSSMAVHTAVLFLLIPVGFLCARPASGLIGLVTRGDAAGAFVRRMLPATLIVPPVLGGLRLLGERAGWFTAGFGEAVVAAGAMAAFSGLVCWSARSVRMIEADKIRATEALLASEAKFRATIEAAPVGIVMVDAAGAIVLANPEAEKLFGYPPGELHGGSVERLVPGQFRAAHPAWRTQFAADPQVRRMGRGRVLAGVRRDGSAFPAEIGLSPVATTGGAFVIATVLDMTAHQKIEADLREHGAHSAKQAEALRQANDALEQSNLALRQFAYAASHDLQTPLRSIGGFAQLLEAEYGGQLDARAGDWLHRIVDSATHMQALIRDVLEYSSVGSRPAQFERVPLREVFDRAVSLLGASISELGAVVTCGDLPAVTGERFQLVRLLENLVANALKYRGADPPRVHVSAERRGGDWVLAVRDNGIGIDPRHHEQIFELFQRLHDQRDYPGTGIGLAVCRGIVERHGGRIWVESEPGHGSTFYFTLPGRNAS